MQLRTTLLFDRKPADNDLGAKRCNAVYLVISILRDTNTNTYANSKTNTNTDQSAKRWKVSENINTALQ